MGWKPFYFKTVSHHNRFNSFRVGVGAQLYKVLHVSPSIFLFTSNFDASSSGVGVSVEVSNASKDGTVEHMRTIWQTSKQRSY